MLLLFFARNSFFSPSLPPWGAGFFVESWGDCAQPSRACNLTYLACKLTYLGLQTNLIEPGKWLTREILTGGRLEGLNFFDLFYACTRGKLRRFYHLASRSASFSENLSCHSKTDCPSFTIWQGIRGLYFTCSILDCPSIFFLLLFFLLKTTSSGQLQFWNAKRAKQQNSS